jgi:hypothetical protein
MGGALGTHGEKRKSYRALMETPEGMRQLGRPRHRWDDIKLDVIEIVWEDVDWIDLAQDRNKWLGSIKWVEFFD